jgi:AcrR family transcriptional regulator
MPAVPPAASPRSDRTAAAILEVAARTLATHPGANMVDIAGAAGVSRPTLYRYYPNREALLHALAAEALDDVGRRLGDAGLDRCAVPEALERIVRAILTVGDRYIVLLSEQVQPDKAKADRAVGDHLQAVIARGIDDGILRDDLPIQVLRELFGGLLGAAVRLLGESPLGLEETAAATTALFLDGARRA